MRKLGIMEHISLDGVIQHSADDDLEGGSKELGVHEPMADIGDDRELQRDDHYGNRGSGPEMGNEVRQRVTQPADSGHEAADGAAHERRAASGERSVVRERLGEAAD